MAKILVHLPLKKKEQKQKDVRRKRVVTEVEQSMRKQQSQKMKCTANAPQGAGGKVSAFIPK